MRTEVIELDMVVQPMAVDVNADYVADLFGSRVVNGSEQTGVWIFNQVGQEFFHYLLRIVYRTRMSIVIISFVCIVV